MSEFHFDVFPSRSSKDKAVVRPLAEKLGKDGLKVWLVPPKRFREEGFDEWVLNPGDHWPSTIEERLGRSRVLVPCILPNSVPPFFFQQRI